MEDLTCNDTLLRRIRTNLGNFRRQPNTYKGLKQAAVGLVVVDIPQSPDAGEIIHGTPRPGQAAMILTRRSQQLRAHSGQWALPGGRVEPGESPQEAVLRELEEEVGLVLESDRVIGRLDDYSTRSGFNIAPVVMWGGTHVHLKANPDEVASIHRIPLAEFLRQDAPLLQKIPESEHPVLMIPIGESWIAAPTAAMIYQFRQVAILGQQCRVAHYEQPYFAWQ